MSIGDSKLKSRQSFPKQVKQLSLFGREAPTVKHVAIFLIFDHPCFLAGGGGIKGVDVKLIPSENHINDE